MKLSRVGELAAILKIKALCRRPGREVVAGIGDDAAAYRAGAGLITLATSDMLVEGVHFDLSYATCAELGFKALAVNISDIAAMGGRPRYYLVSVALRPDFRVEDLEMLYKGMESVAGSFGVYAIGGDTCGTSGPLVISITVLGEAGKDNVVRRSGARPGHDIYVTGSLGDSAGGLELLKSGAGRPKPGASGRKGSAAAKDAAAYLISRHLMPEPRVKAGRMFAEAGLAASMIDISDGLSSDLGHILDESGVGAEVEADRLPISSRLLDVFGRKQAPGLALHGGEDYELLFTARKTDRDKIKDCARRLRTAVTLVGKVTRGKGAFLVSGDGGKEILNPKGYEHFRG